MILDKVGFDSKISLFFQDYLIGIKTKYLLNNFSSSHFNVDIGVRQGSSLSPILSALYLSPIFHILEKILKNLKIPIFIISFVDSRLSVSQDKSFVVSNSHLFYSYYIMFSLLEQVRLVIKYGKTEVFHFSGLHGVFNSPPLDLTTLKGLILHSKETWYYLGFIFNRKLTFRQHINFYVNKTISTIKYMKMLENSSRGLIFTQKYLLYRTCVLSIILYSFLL